MVKPSRPGKLRKKPEDEYVYIPNDFLGTVFRDQASNKMSPQYIASRMFLASPNHLRLTNSDGVDSVYNIRTRELETYTKVPGLQIGEYQDKHFYLDKHQHIKFENMAEMESVLDRIISMNNEFI